jgi:hypothetical protein
MMWIEVLSRHGDVATRARIDSPEARIGRAFDNDVVVDDPHVAPHHLRVFRGEDGGLVAEDLGTLNGLYAEHGARREARLALAGAPGVRIGRTQLRVHDAAQPVAPEKLLTPPRAHAAWAGALVGTLFLMLFALQWLNLTGEPSASELLLPLLGLATLLVLWTGLWAVLSRVFFGQARFALQLRIATTACVALVLWDQFAASASFALAWRDLAEYTGFGAWAVLAGACYGHLHALGPRHMRAAMGLVVVLIVAGALLQYIGKSETRKLVGQRASLGDLRPPAFRMVPLASADDFFKRAEDTRAKVDAARKKPPGGRGLLGDFEPD